jgi:DME family drug/metabolite transporter
LQKATVQRVSAVALAVCGIALAIGIVGATGFRLDGLGVMAAMLAAFSFAFYNIGGHDILARYDRWRVLLYALASAAAFWIIVNPPWKIAAAHYGRMEWLFLILFAITSVLLPFSLYFAGLQHLDATKAIIGSCLEPVFSIVIAATVLGETVRPIQALGMAAVLAAIVLVQIPERGAPSEITAVEPIE